MKWFLIFLFLCGPTTAQVISPPASAMNPALLYAASDLPPGYAFGTLTGGNPTTFASFGMSLATAQGRYNTYATLVTATSQYVDDVVIQYELQKAHARYSVNGQAQVCVPSGTAYLDRQITWSGQEVILSGGGCIDTIGGTLFRTQTVGAGTAALRVTGGFLSGRTVLTGVTLAAFNGGFVSMPGNQGGTPAPGGVPSGMTVPTTFYYYTGAIAIAIDNAAVGVMKNVAIYNYDKPLTFLTANNYIWTFDNFTYQFNNLGINITDSTSNSFEGMTWKNGVSANNNRNVDLEIGTGASGSIFIENEKLDYPNEYQVVTDFCGSCTGDIKMSLTLTNNHIETDSTHTGTANCRVFNNGILIMHGNHGDEEGSFPVGWVCPTFYAREDVSGNEIPGQGNGGTYMPAVYTASPVLWAPTGTGNSARYGGDVILFRSPAGDQMGGPTVYPGGFGNTGSFTLSLLNQLPVNYLIGGGTITVPPAATTHFANGIPLLFEITDTSTWTVACAGPPACTGTLTGIGGTAGTRFILVPTATDVWVK